jgi:hypothetical protein
VQPQLLLRVRTSPEFVPAQVVGHVTVYQVGDDRCARLTVVLGASSAGIDPLRASRLTSAAFARASAKPTAGYSPSVSRRLAPASLATRSPATSPDPRTR